MKALAMLQVLHADGEILLGEENASHYVLTQHFLMINQLAALFQDVIGNQNQDGVMRNRVHNAGILL